MLGPIGFETWIRIDQAALELLLLFVVMSRKSIFQYQVNLPYITVVNSNR
jgi:hypothetical protein